MMSDVRVRQLVGGQVELAFNASQHVELTRSLDDPLVRESLVHAMLDRSSLGSRLKAVSLAAETADEKVREALVFAVRHDPSQPVRVRALEVLARGAVDANVREALIHVLENSLRQLLLPRAEHAAVDHRGDVMQVPMLVLRFMLNADLRRAKSTLLHLAGHQPATRQSERIDARLDGAQVCFRVNESA